MINKINKLTDFINQWIALELSELRVEESLGQALKYSLLSPGKRIRPVLGLLSAEMLGIEISRLRNFALACECIHTASLIHDDLPALDNDDYRRGQLTCHKKFNEATAIITGDFLIAKAFSLLVADKALPTEVHSNWVRLISQATEALCDGQMMDVNFKNYKDKREILENLDLQKTGALITAAVQGAVYLLPQIEQKEAEKALFYYGQSLGLLFQVTDDLLDGQQDQIKESPSYTSFFNQAEVEGIADDLLKNCQKSLEFFGSRAGDLVEIAKMVRYRKS